MPLKSLKLSIEQKLINAIKNGRPETFHVLLNEQLNKNIDININCRDDLGNTAAHYAYANNQTGIIETLLLIEKLDLTIRNNDGKTAEEVASPETKNWILRSFPVKNQGFSEENINGMNNFIYSGQYIDFCADENHHTAYPSNNNSHDNPKYYEYDDNIIVPDMQTNIYGNYSSINNYSYPSDQYPHHTQPLHSKNDIHLIEPSLFQTASFEYTLQYQDFSSSSEIANPLLKKIIITEDDSCLPAPPLDRTFTSEQLLKWQTMALEQKQSYPGYLSLDPYPMERIHSLSSMGQENLQSSSHLQQNFFSAQSDHNHSMNDGYDAVTFTGIAP